MGPLHYLTVQDVLWINLQVAGSPLPFKYSELEEATFYQYAYGDSRGLALQAIRFLSGFKRLNPFSAGNDATAFLGFVAFLRLNHADVELPDPAKWFKGFCKGDVDPELTLADLIRSHEAAHEGVGDDRRHLLGSVLSEYGSAIGLKSAKK